MNRKLKVNTIENKTSSLIRNRSKFSDYLYTDWHFAVDELQKRNTDKQLKEYVNGSFDGKLPQIMKNSLCAVYFRHVASLNYETYRFLMFADVLKELKPVIFELTKDKFTDVNSLKKALGKMPFFKKMNKKNEPLIEYETIIDMSQCNGKSISSLKTNTGENLVKYHHDLLLKRFPHMKSNIFDISDWLEHDCGKHTAAQWYKKFLKLFLVNGILFENFLTTGEDARLTKEVVLPAFIEIEMETGYKPIIVALDPTDEENDAFWEYYPTSIRTN